MTKTLASRNSILYAGLLISSAFSGLIAAGILKMDGLGGVQGWRYLFIIEGGITVLTVPFAYFILPDNPSNTKFLSQEEKRHYYVENEEILEMSMTLIKKPKNLKYKDLCMHAKISRSGFCVLFTCS